MAGRLREQILGEAQSIFRRNNLITPVTDVSLMLFINVNGPSSIAEIARALEFSHQRVALRINALEKLKLLTRKINPNDQRCKLIAMTPLAKKEMIFIEKMYINASEKIEQMFNEIDIDLMDGLQKAITYLKQNPIQEPG